ncbi:MAG: hypothetical protein J6K48_13650 [Lachnospiraceae bacterium]|nr:hypothetical protein [Lachnospiraceae bacterium]
MAEEKDIFEIIIENSVNERMDNILLENEEYIKIQNKIDEQIERFNELDLDREQRLVVDRLVSFYTESGALYGRMTYKQGFMDCVSLLQKINLIKAS